MTTNIFPHSTEDQFDESALNPAHFSQKKNSHRPPSWIASERRDWKLVSRFCFGQQSPVHRRFYSVEVKRVPQKDLINIRNYDVRHLIPKVCSAVLKNGAEISIESTVK